MHETAVIVAGISAGINDFKNYYILCSCGFQRLMWLPLSPKYKCPRKRAFFICAKKSGYGWLHTCSVAAELDSSISV